MIDKTTNRLLYDFTHMRDLKQSNSQRDKVQWWLTEVGGGGGWRMGELFNGYIVSFEGDGKILEMDDGEGCTT